MENKIENRPIITFQGESPTPGVASEIWERYRNWSREVYVPLILSMPGRRGIDSYEIVKESAGYPPLVQLIHLENIRVILEHLKNQARTDVIREAEHWIERHVLMFIWHETYALVKSFRSKPSATPHEEDTRIENAPVLHIESYRVRKEEQDKYDNWLNDYGFGSFIPLLMRLPGIKGYDCYRDVGSAGIQIRAREWEYPEFLSLLYFEDETAFENYTKSPELLAFQKAISNVFPNGLNLKWYVQYQLIESFRK